MTPDGAKFACYYAQRGDDASFAQARIEVWDVRTGMKREIEGTQRTLSLAISPDGKWLAYGTQMGEVGVWNLPVWVLANKFKPHRGMVHGLAFSPDGKRLATGGVDQGIRIWETGTTNLLGTRIGHLSEIWSLHFSRDGQKLISSSLDGTAKLWDAGPGSARSHTFAVPMNSWITGPLPDLSGIMTIDFTGKVRVTTVPSLAEIDALERNQ